jgi:hypothetical protein
MQRTTSCCPTVLVQAPLDTAEGCAYLALQAAANFAFTTARCWQCRARA